MSLSQKFSFWIISILLLIGFSSAYLYYKSEMRDEALRIESLAGTVGPVLERSLDDYMLTRDSDALDRTLDNLKGIKPIGRIVLINREGVVKASTERKDIDSVLSTGDAGCRECHEKGLRSLFLKSEGMFRWAQPITNKPACYKCHNSSIRINGVFIIDFSTAEVSMHVARHMYRGLLILILSLGCISLAVIVLSKTVVIRRLNGVIYKIRKFKEGDYNSHMLLKGNDEITRLEENFNEMAEAITEREKERSMLYKQVSRSYEQWQHTFDSITELISIIDTEGNIVRANRTFMEYFGVSGEDLREKKCLDFFCGEKVPEKSSSDKTADIHRAEQEVVDRNGRTFRISTFPYAYPEADFQGAILVARDVTERKRMEEAIREQLDFLQVLINAIPNPIFYKDVHGVYLGCNKAFEEYVGLGREQIIGKTVYDVASGALADAYHEADLALFRQPGVQTYESRVVYADGTEHDVILYKATFHEPDGTLRGLVGTILDITERKRLEEEREKLIIELRNTVERVSRSQKMWQDTFDSIGDIISVHDQNFNIVRVNRAFAEYFGIAPRDAIGKKCYDLFHEDNVPALNCPHRMTLDENRPFTVEHLNAKTNRIFRISTFPFTIPENESQGSIHIVRDITDEKEKEMRLIMSERLAALGQMASGVAHEINNPLAAILGCAEGLMSRVKKGQFKPELFENYLGIIEEEISRCKNITTSMLSFVRKTTYENKEIIVNEDLDKTLEIIGFQGRLRNVGVVRNYMPGIPIIQGNEGELRQTFMAIITNALDAMEDSGTLTLETGAEAETVFIKISDSGPGIPAEVIDKIFDPFFTTKSETGGTGLGLSIAGKIISNHKGSIQVTTEQGKGTTFKIILPLK